MVGNIPQANARATARGVLEAILWQPTQPAHHNTTAVLMYSRVRIACENCRTKHNRKNKAGQERAKETGTRTAQKEKEAAKKSTT